MTSTDRLAACSERSVAEPAASEARLMAAEIERQADPRDKLALAQHATLLEAMAEIERLRARVIILEAQRQGDELMAAAMRRGTPAQPTPDEPTTITHDIPPSAPPHDER